MNGSCTYKDKKVTRFMSNRRFKKGTFSRKIRIYFFLLSNFCTLFAQKRTICYPTTIFELLITHKRWIFEESYISYGKRQKSCTLIVILVKCLCLTSPTFNSSAKSNRLFLLQRRKYITIQAPIKQFCPSLRIPMFLFWVYSYWWFFFSNINKLTITS